MSAPRRHHLLPQFYLRSFADEDGKVRVIDRATGHEFTTGTGNVFVERDYYTVSSVEAEDDHQLIEGMYARIEGVAAPVFEQLRAGDFPLDGQDRSEFASFMALQVSRGRMFRRWMEQLTDQMGRMMLRMAADAPPGYWEAKRTEWEANPEGAEPPPRHRARGKSQLHDEKLRAAMEDVGDRLERVRSLLREGRDDPAKRGAFAEQIDRQRDQIVITLNAAAQRFGLRGLRLPTSVTSHDEVYDE